jgi:hypothetical protein
MLLLHADLFLESNEIRSFVSSPHIMVRKKFNLFIGTYRCLPNMMSIAIRVADEYFKLKYPS